MLGAEDPSSAILEFAGAKAKLDELFVTWLCQKDTAELVEGCVQAALNGEDVGAKFNASPEDDSSHHGRMLSAKCLTSIDGGNHLYHLHHHNQHIPNPKSPHGKQQQMKGTNNKENVLSYGARDKNDMYR